MNLRYMFLNFDFANLSEIFRPMVVWVVKPQAALSVASSFIVKHQCLEFAIG